MDALLNLEGTGRFGGIGGFVNVSRHRDNLLVNGLGAFLFGKRKILRGSKKSFNGVTAMSSGERAGQRGEFQRSGLGSRHINGPTREGQRAESERVIVLALTLTREETSPFLI